MSDSSMVERIAKLLGVDRDKVEDRLTDLDLDVLLDVVDAASREDVGRVRAALGMGDEKANAEAAPTEDKDSDDEQDINPLFSKEAPEPHNVEEKDDDEEDEDREIEEEDGEQFQPNMGDEVSVGDDDAGEDREDGTVNIPRGPNNTVGVQIDGETRMVDRKDVHREISESIMGMTSMSDLRRMQQLAGMTAAPSPMDTIEIAADTTAAEPCALAAGTVATVPAPEEAAPVATDCAFDGVLQSFDDIEAAIPEMKVRDAKIVRQRINNLLAKLNESAKRQRRKI